MRGGRGKVGELNQGGSAAVHLQDKTLGAWVRKEGENCDKSSNKRSAKERSIQVDKMGLVRNLRIIILIKGVLWQRVVANKTKLWINGSMAELLLISHMVFPTLGHCLALGICCCTGGSSLSCCTWPASDDGDGDGGSGRAVPMSLLRGGSTGGAPVCAGRAAAWPGTGKGGGVGGGGDGGGCDGCCDGRCCCTCNGGWDCGGGGGTLPALAPADDGEFELLVFVLLPLL